MTPTKICLILGFIVLSACSDNKESMNTAPELIRPAKIVLVEAAGENSNRIFPGTVEAAVKSELAFRVSGQLEKLQALPGKHYKKGELLAELDDSEFSNTLRDKEAKFSLAKSQYTKISALIDQGHVSPTEVEQAEANLKAAESALVAAQDNLKHTRLLAPFDGVVANVQTENHQVINAHETILELRGEGNLETRFSIPESLLGKVKRIEDPTSLCVQVRFNAFPEKSYPACFKEFESTPDRLTRTYSVVHTLPNITEFTALPGMAVTVEVDLSRLLREELSKGVLVPLSSVFEENDQTFVWRVAEDGSVIKQAVSVSGIQAEKLLVIEGLSPNQAIVSVGVTFIHQGMKVRPITKERGL